MDFSGYIFGVYASHSKVVREKVWWELASMRGILSAVGVRFGSQAATAIAAPAKEAAKPSNDNNDDDYIDLFEEEKNKAKKAAEASEAAEAFTKNKENGKSPIFKDVKTWDDKTGMNKIEEAVRSFDVEAFSNLHTESGFKYVNDHISGKTCISRDQLTENDIKVYGEILEQPCSDIYPNASKWYHAVFAKLVSSFPEKAFGMRFGSQNAPSIVVPTKEAAKPSDDNDNNDVIDQFGKETKEEKKTAEAREVAKASTKKKVVPSIEVEGLLWATSKLVLVGYGFTKKQIMLNIIDELVSIDTLIEERLTVQPIKEYLQSCDIVTFNKI
ncbi:hypothetical protein CQW23_02024 [Capsicum baccatum]|uniref:Translation elongation factor EF1B beta/delta subunit guanine nucleotide exchange domain-containing protein n=1 Tax=Capsicum baccatum TaxID=33114 RepID=A0A2G2XQM5_CAPBA|nr:hypothetical protein CQW23_02024 [Capsicum baccatum]